jgi:hypothetical protein
MPILSKFKSFMGNCDHSKKWSNLRELAAVKFLNST